MEFSANKENVQRYVAVVSYLCSIAQLPSWINRRSQCLVQLDYENTEQATFSTTGGSAVAAPLPSKWSYSLVNKAIKWEVDCHKYKPQDFYLKNQMISLFARESYNSADNRHFL